MSEETKKILTEEELSQLKAIRNQQQQITFALGDVQLRKESLLASYRNVASQEQELLNKLSIKYGDGNINLTTGEIEPYNPNQVVSE
jgi:hypothetical protein